jgi:hypothetical protein
VDYLLSQTTRDRLMRLLREQGGDAPHHGHVRGRRWALVQCLSTTPVGGDTVLAQCYPAKFLAPEANTVAPPGAETAGVVLTVLGDSGNSVTPRLNAVYECLVVGEVRSDGVGSVAGRVRAFGVQTVGGSGTANYLPLWTSAGTLGDSQWRQSGADLVNDTALSSINVGPGFATAGAPYCRLVSDAVVPNLVMTTGGGTPRTATLSVNPGLGGTPNSDGIWLGVATPTQTFWLVGNGYYPSFGVADQQSPPSFRPGLTGTLGPGAVVTGGIVTNVGSGSFPSVAANNTWTGTNSFTGAVTMPMAADVVPLTVQGGGAGTSNILVAKTAGGSTALSLSGAGVLTADGSGLTNIGAGSLTGGAKAAIAALTPCYAYLN